MFKHRKFSPTSTLFSNESSTLQLFTSLPKIAGTFEDILNASVTPNSDNLHLNSCSNIAASHVQTSQNLRLFSHVHAISTGFPQAYSRQAFLNSEFSLCGRHFILLVLISYKANTLYTRQTNIASRGADKTLDLLHLAIDFRDAVVMPDL